MPEKLPEIVVRGGPRGISISLTEGDISVTTHLDPDQAYNLAARVKEVTRSLCSVYLPPR